MGLFGFRVLSSKGLELRRCGFWAEDLALHSIGKGFGAWGIMMSKGTACL